MAENTIVIFFTRGKINQTGGEAKEGRKEADRREEGKHLPSIFLPAEQLLQSGVMVTLITSMARFLAWPGKLVPAIDRPPWVTEGGSMRRGGDIPFPSILLTRLLRQCLPVRKSVRPSIGVRGAPANFGTFPKTADEVDVLRTYQC